MIGFIVLAAGVLIGAHLPGMARLWLIITGPVPAGAAIGPGYGHHEWARCACRVTLRCEITLIDQL